MTEPRIQYAKTKDGVSIAFWVAGRGPPIVWVPDPPFSHIQLEWRVPVFRKAFELFAAKRSVVRFDPRGLGLSDRDVDDLSLDSRILDLEAVVDRLGFETFTLFAVVRGAPLAIVYAARCYQRVSHLVLVNPIVSEMEAMQVPRWQALAKLSDSDWELYLESVGAQLLGLGHEEAQRWADWARACATPETGRRYLNAMAGDDVTEYLPRVRAQTLLGQPTGLSFLNLDTARKLASNIPNAQLVTPEGNLQESVELLLAAIDEFLGEGEEAAAGAELPEGMAVILFADIVESTALTEQMGDAAFRAKARELDESLRTIIRECGGTPVEGKLVGDGVLAVFTSARQAIECALRCGTASQPLGLQLHLGIHAGDVIREGNNVYGGAVNIAARIATASAPGEVLVSDTVRSLARTSAGVSFDDRGEHSLKGIAEPQRLFAVRGGS
ncbi:MAG: adenylate/guanylate cyclase domain-containing protein [Dehalococcoidia bacterium]